MKYRLGLRGKILCSFLTLIGLMGCFFIVTSYQKITEILHSELEIHGVNVAKTFSQLATPSILESDYIAIDGIMMDLANTDEIDNIAIVDTKAGVWSTTKKYPDGYFLQDEFYNQLIKDKSSGFRRITNNGHEIIEVVSPILTFGKVRYLTVLEINTQRIEQQVNERMRENILITFGLIFLASLFSILLSRLITSKLHKLVIATQEASKGNFDYRLNIKSNDEIADVATSFNYMNERLKETSVSRDYLEVIINNLSSMLIVTTSDGTVEIVNQAALNFLDCSANEILGTNIEKLADRLNIHDQTITVPLSFINQSFQNQEGVLRVEKGEDIPLLLSASSFKDVIHNNQTHTIVVGTDIRDRKDAENRVRQSELSFRSLFNSLPEAVFIQNKSGIILSVNDGAIRMYGHSVEWFIGKKPLDISAPDLNDIDALIPLHEEAMDGIPQKFEFWGMRADGVIFPTEVHQTKGVWFDQDVVISVAIDITERWEHEKQLKHIAHFDTLTGLSNRLLLSDRLHQAMELVHRHDTVLAICFLDIDGFKDVNDTHGHEVGDQLLVTISKRMEHVLRGGDTLARLGGDEFVVLLQDLEGQEECTPIIENLLGAIYEPISLDGRTVQVSASIGVTFYPQDESIDADQLLRQADQAMYQAKQTGKNKYHLFDDEQDRHVRGYHESLERIRQALHDREFVLYYQPKINMRTGQVIGVEALIRWDHPDLGILAPGAFLPVVENDMLSVDIGEWVLETAIEQIEIWRKQGVEWTVSVNIDALHLEQPHFVEQLKNKLHAHPQVAHGCLELEVLETSALEDIHQVSEIIHACEALGVRFTIDDFGTGYSSLTYLKRLPVFMLKIDQSFVRDMLVDPEDLAILEGIQSLASAFNLSVLAEGVETVEHGKLLLQLGCELAQGYVIAKPMPANEISDWQVDWSLIEVWQNVSAVGKDNTPILYASVEHRAWVSQLNQYLHGVKNQPPELNSSTCRFGRWLAKSEGTKLFNHPNMARVISLHDEVHATAETVIESFKRGDNNNAFTGFEEIEERQEELLVLLTGLVK